MSRRRRHFPHTYTNIHICTHIVWNRNTSVLKVASSYVFLKGNNKASYIDLEEAHISIMRVLWVEAKNGCFFFLLLFLFQWGLPLSDFRHRSIYWCWFGKWLAGLVRTEAIFRARKCESRASYVLFSHPRKKMRFKAQLYVLLSVVQECVVTNGQGEERSSIAL